MLASIAIQVRQSPAISSETRNTWCEIGAAAARDMQAGLGAALANAEAWESANNLADLLG